MNTQPTQPATDPWTSLGLSLEEAFQQTLTWIVSFALLLLLVMLWWRIFRVWRTAAKAHRCVHDETAAGTLSTLRDALLSAGLTHIGAAITRFERSLVAVPGGGLRRTASASSYVNHEAIVAEANPSGRSHFNPVISVDALDQVPGWCTGLGILGTFVGVSIGLGEIGGLSEASSKGANLDKAILPVIENLASAFWTSIFGVIAATLAGFLTRRSSDLVERTSAELCQRLEALTSGDSGTTNALADVTAQVLNDAVESELVTDFIDRVEDNPLDLMLQTAVERVLENPTLVALVGQATLAMNQRFDRFVKVISDRVESSQQIAEDHVKAFTEKAVGRISAAVKGQMAEMAEEFRSLRDGAASLSTQLAASASESSNLQRSMHESAATARDSMEAVRKVASELGGLVATMRQSLTQTTTELDDFARRLGDRIRSTLEETHTTTSGIKRQLTELTSGSDALTRALEGLPGIVGALGTFQEGLFTQLAQAQTRVTETFVKLEAEMRKAQVQQATALTTAFGDLRRQVSTDLEGAAQQLVTARDTLDEGRQRLDALQAGIGESVSRLREAGENLRVTSSETRQMAVNQASMQAALRTLLDRATLLTDELRTLPSMNHGLVQHLERMSSDFASLKTSLDAVSTTTIAGALDELRQSLSGTGLANELRGLSARLTEVRDALKANQGGALAATRGPESLGAHAQRLNLSLRKTDSEAGP